MVFYGVAQHFLQVFAPRTRMIYPQWRADKTHYTFVCSLLCSSFKQVFIQILYHLLWLTVILCVVYCMHWRRNPVSRCELTTVVRCTKCFETWNSTLSNTFSVVYNTFLLRNKDNWYINNPYLGLTSHTRIAEKFQLFSKSNWRKRCSMVSFLTLWL